jgi:nucleotide-binding universal stress UspA family protein
MTVVLAPIDGSTRALRAVPWAARLAGSGGTVILLRAIPPEPAYADAIVSFAGGPDAVTVIRNEWNTIAQADIDEAAQLLASSGITIEPLVVEGEPDVVISQAARERGVDMIAMASHGRGAIGRAIFGSVADRVARTATVPVLILRVADETDDTDSAAVRRIVLPLDGSPLAAQAIPVATAISRKLAVPVHVVRVVDPVNNLPISTGTLGPAPSIAAEVADRLWDEAENAARETVRAAITQLQADGIDASGTTLQGSPFFAISEATKPDDLIVLTSHGRGGVQRWLLGSVAEKLIREAPAPVVLVPTAERIAAES